ncbi:prefoldin subunit 6 [Cantharellus anzutake]|uniref:prefoldin subunit 6 n=1 Tax=Cantharellus anzutake TaxID=1750568 RepID=UPI00190759D2|nr:prefoldin subunit 6 [Cantharellus anzutake]KAF8327614.1 prefoldin subunit 6 [Cantharellus anzutake]
MEALKARLESASLEYQELQQELSSAVEVRQRLDAQLNENDLVQKEFRTLKPENTVYKLVGPVLVPQDQEEAKQNIAKRIDLIKGDINRVEKQLKDLTEKSEQKKMEIVETQAAAQGIQQKNGKKAAEKATAT